MLVRLREGNRGVHIGMQVGPADSRQMQRQLVLCKQCKRAAHLERQQWQWRVGDGRVHAGDARLARAQPPLHLLLDRKGGWEAGVVIVGKRGPFSSVVSAQ